MTKRTRSMDLRRRAEQELRKAHPKAVSKTRVDSKRLLQELHIHQIEMEMQNEELRQAKMEAEATLEQYRDLYDFAPVGYFNLARDGTIRMANLTGAALLGTDRSQLAGRFLADHISPGQRPALYLFMKSVFAGRAGQSADFQLLGGKLPGRTVNIEARRLPDGLECRAIIVDISERKAAEEKVLISETRYRRLFEAAQDGVLLVDPATRKITDSNPYMTSLLGYPQHELIGKEVFEIGLLEDSHASREMFRLLKKTHHVRYENLPLKSRRGKHQQVEVVANLYQENGQPVVQLNVRDITRRKEAEEILRRNAALFSGLVEEAPVGVYVVDGGFRLMQVNGKARPVFGGLQPLIGRDFSEILLRLWPKRLSEKVGAQFRRTLKTGEAYHSPVPLKRRHDAGGEGIYEWQIQRITLPGGEFGVVAFVNDITERMRAEEVRRRLVEETASNGKLKLEIVRREATERALTHSESQTRQLLHESRQLHEKVRLMSHQNLLAQEQLRKSISHELHDKISQVLIGINVQLEIFTKRAAISPEGIPAAVAPVRRLVKESVRIVHNFARELRPSMLDHLGLIPALRMYIKDLPRRKGRSIELSASAGVETLDHDKRTVLFRVAQEALVNVAKHSRAHLVTVDLRRVRARVWLTITDDGRGFDVTRLSSPGWGDRLGVTGMRERVEMAGGRFRIESKSGGGGTSVRAEVPIATG